MKLDRLAKIVLLSFIFFSAVSVIVFRALTFSQFPQVLNRDELALAYNAWTIVTDGVDEWGEDFPLVFRSFGDYKLPGYIYTLSGLFFLFGDHDFLVRAPSLIASIGIALLAGLAGYKITHSKMGSMLIGAIVATSQWSLHYGNVGFEANVSLFLFLASLFGYWKSRHHSKWFILGSIAYIISALTYNTPMLLVPLIMLVLRFMKKVTTFQLFITFIIWLSIVLAQSTAIVGKAGISIFSDQGLQLAQQELRQNNASFTGRVLYHPITFYTRKVASNMLSHFSPSFLVFQGGKNPWHQPPGFGHIQWPYVLLAVIGIGSAARSRNTFLRFMLVMIPIALIPAAITIDAPHATRSLFFFFLISFFAGVGVEQMFKNTYTSIVAIVLLFFAVLSTTTYMKSYAVAYAAKIQSEWRSELWQELNMRSSLEVEDAQQYCILGDPQYDYIVILWKERIPVYTFLKTRELGEKNLLGFRPVERLGNEYTFSINCLDYTDQTQ